MATVILSTVGAIIGGPIGGAIGAIVGQQIDQAIFGSGGKTREGPRLKELEVQTSSYGTQIPAIFGAMRVAGTVIWSTDLIERRKKSGGGKNRPSSVEYSYAASFAVAVSSRQVARVGRIWADGNLLRGAAGDFKSETIFRFHNGTGEQLPDPLMSSAETIGQCPAYRNLAYAVFEDLQLADFGNRIPSLTFEIFERETDVSIIDIAAECSNNLIAGQSGASLTGFAAQGTSCRAALGGLLSTFPVLIRSDGDHLVLNDWSAANNTPILLGNPALADGNDRIERPKRSREAGSRAPSVVSIRHYERERDFQAGVQSSRRIGPGRSELQIELAATLGANDARAIADIQLLQKWRNLNGLGGAMPRNAESVRVGDWVQSEESGQPLRITELEHQRGTTRILAREWTDALVLSLAAEPGRNQADPDLAIGETRMILAELPAFGTQDPGKPVIVAAAAGTEAGWRRAALSLVEGERIVDIGQSKAPATIGTLQTPLPEHSPLLLDMDNRPIIRLLHGGMTLPPGTGSIASFDAPALWIGGEIIRYAQAEQVAAREFRLSGLLRGVSGRAENFSHAAGAQMFLIEADSLTVIDALPAPVGSIMSVEALGSGDAAPVGATVNVQGYAITPQSPVHGKIDPQSNGDVRLDWVRRERMDFGWADEADMPNSEGGTEFWVELRHLGEIKGSWQVLETTLLIPAAQWAALNLPSGSIIQFDVLQQGRLARTAPLSFSAIL